MNHRRALAGALCALAGGLSLMAGAAQTTTYKGLEITPKAVERSRIVSLQDCPPGENIVRGVIRPTEDMEFATIQIDVKVLPSFDGAQLPKPVIYDDSGNAYKTAQSFRDLNAEPSYSCGFSFRVPKGTKLSRFEIEDASFDVSELKE